MAASVVSTMVMQAAVIDGPWADAVTRHIAAIQAARDLGDRFGQANALTDPADAVLVLE